MPDRTELKSHGDLVAERASRDPTFREEWDRTALARAFAIELIRYRADHDLAQAGLAGLLGVDHAQVARWELGEENPSQDALARILAELNIELPADR